MKKILLFVGVLSAFAFSFSFINAQSATSLRTLVGCRPGFAYSSTTGELCTTPTTTTTTTSSCSPLTYNLVVGSSDGAAGGQVTRLQEFLKAKGHLDASISTGYFGAQTKQALASYQAAKGISPAEGSFGPITRAVVNAEICVTTTATTSSVSVPLNSSPSSTTSQPAPITDQLKYVTVSAPTTTLVKGSSKAVIFTWSTPIVGGSADIQLVNVETKRVYIIKTERPNDQKGNFTGDLLSGVPVGHYQIRVVITAQNGEKVIGTSRGVVQVLPANVSAAEEKAAQNYASVIDAIIQLMKN